MIYFRGWTLSINSIMTIIERDNNGLWWSPQSSIGECHTRKMDAFIKSHYANQIRSCVHTPHSSYLLNHRTKKRLKKNLRTVIFHAVHNSNNSIGCSSFACKTRYGQHWLLKTNIKSTFVRYLCWNGECAIALVNGNYSRTHKIVMNQMKVNDFQEMPKKRCCALSAHRKCIRTALANGQVAWSSIIQ